MLTREDNNVLTQVGRGTPMGELIRRFWIPALLASEIAEPGGKPVRVRLLGEDLVAFRDTDGKVGLLDEQCPHRRASLALGDNSDGGLRCLYHGWKFATDGTCLDTPTEPSGSAFCSRIRAQAYPTREIGGVIWTYMGPAASCHNSRSSSGCRIPPSTPCRSRCWRTATTRRRSKAPSTRRTRRAAPRAAVERAREVRP